MKLLEVIQDENCEISFKTELDTSRSTDLIPSIAPAAFLTIVTNLWGGEEKTVIDVIRALFIADIAASVNPDEILDQMKESAMILKSIFEEASLDIEDIGSKITVSEPEVKPYDTRS